MKNPEWIKIIVTTMQTLMFLANWDKIETLITSKRFAKSMRYISIAFVPLGLLLALLVNNVILLKGEVMNSYIAFVLIFTAVLGFAFFNYRLWSDSKFIIS
jgi:fatty acid desaturase